MYGDRSGSPRRDSRHSRRSTDRRDLGFRPSAEAPASPVAIAPHTDVHVAGAPLEEITDLDVRSPARRHGLIKIGAAAAAAVVVVGGGTVGAMAMTGGSGNKQTVASAPVADPARSQPSEAELKAAEAERLKRATERASRAARKDFAVRPALAPKGTPLPTKSPKKKSLSLAVAGNPVPAGEAQKIAKGLLSSFGFEPSTQFGCLVELWTRESGWRVNAANPSGAYGIPQALPGSKMSSAGPNWQSNPTTQIKWGLGYIKSRYKTPCGAWSTFQSQGWY
ncbi:MAG: hypothetical protein JWO67_3895 [Streptosporangiaceae bacterium]|nr:hypothetical protein [Streptosporangiaceae bacterium]